MTVSDMGVVAKVMYLFNYTAVNVEFTQTVFSVFENEPEMIIILEVSRPALTEFTVIVVASSDTADGKKSCIYILMCVTMSSGDIKSLLKCCDPTRI